MFSTWHFHAWAGGVAALSWLGAIAPAAAQTPDFIDTGIVELRINTCNLDLAETSSPVYAEFDFLDVDANGKERRTSELHRLNRPATDTLRGAQDRYVFPGFGQLSRLAAVRLINGGDDAWCVSGLQVFVNGQGAAMSYWGDRPDARYVGPFASSPKALWISADPADGHPASLTFSDFSSIVNGTSFLVGFYEQPLPTPVFISVTAGPISSPEITPISVQWWHDGAQADVVKFLRPEPGKTVTALLGTYVDEIESLALTMEADGPDNGFIAQRVTVWSPFRSGRIGTWADLNDLGVLGHWGYENFHDRLNIITSKVSGRSSLSNQQRGQVHLPLRRSGAYFDTLLDVITRSTTPSPICAPPTSFENAELESMIAGMIVDSWDACSGVRCDWFGGSVQVTQRSASVAHAHVDFAVELEGPLGGDHKREVDVDFDLSLSCGDGQLRFDVSGLQIAMETKAIDVFAALLSKKLREKLIQGYARLSAIDIGSISTNVPVCPTRLSVSSEGDINFRWPASPVPNPLCRAH